MESVTFVRRNLKCQNMKKIKFICLLTIALGMLMTQSCQRKNADSNDGNAVYYWKTTFKLNGYEREFLEKHHVTKMYVKFFDVADEWEGVVPVGTLIFLDSMPQNVEIVPTVFITSGAIKKYDRFMEKMFNRLVTMAETNNVEFHEIQIDCDWTEESKDAYFAFMKEFRALLKKHDITLSTTIRLFQLEYDVPAADYGVLMCYNTGEIDDWETNNSILDPAVVKTYLPKLKGYKLPLSVAFPQFSWDIAFNKHKSMLHINYNKMDFSDKSRFKKIENNKYEVVSDKNVRDDEDDYFDDTYWNARYFRHEEVSLKDLLEVKDKVLENMSQKPIQVIIYQLDSANLSNLSDHDVEKIYR